MRKLTLKVFSYLVADVPLKKIFKGRGYRKSGRFLFTHVFLRMH